MTFVIGAEELEQYVMNIYVRDSYELGKTHVAVVHFSLAEEKWNPIGSWRTLSTIALMVGMSEQQLLRRLNRKKEIIFKLNVEEL